MIKMRLLFIITTLLFVSGCQDPSMKEMKKNHPKIVTDENGKKYVIEHYIGNTYTFKPLDDDKGNK